MHFSAKFLINFTIFLFSYPENIISTQFDSKFCKKCGVFCEKAMMWIKDVCHFVRAATRVSDFSVAFYQE